MKTLLIVSHFKNLITDDPKKAFKIYLAYGVILEKHSLIGPLTTDYQVNNTTRQRFIVSMVEALFRFSFAGLRSG